MYQSLNAPVFWSIQSLTFKPRIFGSSSPIQHTIDKCVIVFDIQLTFMDNTFQNSISLFRLTIKIDRLSNANVRQNSDQMPKIRAAYYWIIEFYNQILLFSNKKKIIIWKHKNEYLEPNDTRFILKSSMSASIYTPLFWAMHNILWRDFFDYWKIYWFCFFLF